MRSRQNEMASEHEAALRREKMIIQDLNAKVSSIEVDKSIAVAARTDLIQEVARLQRQLDDKEQQLRRMTRALEDKDQTLAEAAPVIREQQRQQRGVGRASRTKSSSKRTETISASVGNGKPRTVTSTVSNVTFGASKWRY
eukprot:m.77901 g.77901  ORF g.77901 m.77901 type:complete len:141 (-) comp14491_c0_seq2:81-503(-)